MSESPYLPKRTPLSEKYLLTIEEASEYLSMSVGFLRERIADGDMGYAKIGRSRRFYREDLERWSRTFAVKVDGYGRLRTDVENSEFVEKTVSGRP